MSLKLVGEVSINPLGHSKLKWLDDVKDEINEIFQTIKKEAKKAYKSDNILGLFAGTSGAFDRLLIFCEQWNRRLAAKKLPFHIMPQVKYRFCFQNKAHITLGIYESQIIDYSSRQRKSIVATPESKERNRMHSHHSWI